MSLSQRSRSGRTCVGGRLNSAVSSQPIDPPDRAHEHSVTELVERLHASLDEAEEVPLLSMPAKRRTLVRLATARAKLDALALRLLAEAEATDLKTWPVAVTGTRSIGSRTRPAHASAAARSPAAACRGSPRSRWTRETSHRRNSIPVQGGRGRRRLYPEIELVLSAVGQQEQGPFQQDAELGISVRRAHMSNDPAATLDVLGALHGRRTRRRRDPPYPRHRPRRGRPQVP